MTGGRSLGIVDRALEGASDWPTDLRAVIEGGTFDPPPWNILLGPVRPRGAPAGAVVAGRRTLLQWGPTDRADMAFSVTKSYIGVLAALALDRGLIGGFDAPISASVSDPAFASGRNASVTWRQLLDQTSEWEGSIFGIPDSVDRDRQLAPTDDPARFGRATPLQEPGSYWDYNDARVNALCLALTRLFGCALPEVLAKAHPAFAHRKSWTWDGYGAASSIDLDGKPVEVAVGGGHWGGGLVATLDHHLALGITVRDGGKWNGQRVISSEALTALLTPCRLQPVYGGLWWFNDGRRLFPSAPEDSLFAMGVGATVVWLSPGLDMVACLRWIRPDAVDDVLFAILHEYGGVGG
jgi:CubicO group peptidase (beta-lactamase class C family)